jgi:hypothetical protein
MKSKGILLILGIVLLMLGLQGIFSACAQPKQGKGEVTFLVTANVRGQIDPCG